MPVRKLQIRKFLKNTTQIYLKTALKAVFFIRFLKYKFEVEHAKFVRRKVGICEPKLRALYAKFVRRKSLHLRTYGSFQLAES